MSVKSAKKVMLSVFLDTKEILVIDFLSKVDTITRKYCNTLLKQLNKIIRKKKKEDGSAKKKIICHADMAPPHTSVFVCNGKY